jgi:hypothetical protein
MDIIEFWILYQRSGGGEGKAQYQFYKTCSLY